MTCNRELSLLYVEPDGPCVQRRRRSPTSPGSDPRRGPSGRRGHRVCLGIGRSLKTPLNNIESNRGGDRGEED
jgi:hypothetical protein